MALTSNIQETSFGIPVSGAYTVITSVSVEKRPFFAAPAQEGGEPIVVSSHTVRFTAESWSSQASRDERKSPVAGYGFTAPYDVSVQQNVLAYLYEWLKANVITFSEATDA